MKEIVRVSAVSFINTLPFVYGLKYGLLSGKIKLSLDYPSICAQRLIEGDVDVGLIPVAAIRALPHPHIISNYCIGAVGKVRSVMLYSDVPMSEIKEVLLDYQSMTSVQLVQVLAREYWNINPVWMNADKDYIKHIKAATAGLVIGDRTFGLEEKYKYSYDLAGEWTQYTKLPFVFACWVSNKVLPFSFVQDFDKAMAFGLLKIDDAVAGYDNPEISHATVKSYLHNDISYNLDDEKRKGMEMFLGKM